MNKWIVLFGNSVYSTGIVPMRTERYKSCTMAFVVWFHTEISIDITVNPTTWTLQWQQGIKATSNTGSLTTFQPENEKIEEYLEHVLLYVGIKDGSPAYCDQ